MPEADAPTPDPTLVERWLIDQQQWQKTLFTYLDAMMKNDEFLMHLGNAMRGSLLAGKPYPTAAAQAPAEADPSTDRLDKVLFALHQLQGQVQEILMTLDEMRGTRKTSPTRGPAQKGSPAKRTRTAAAARPSRRRTRR